MRQGRPAFSATFAGHLMGLLAALALFALSIRYLGSGVTYACVGAVLVAGWYFVERPAVEYLRRRRLGLCVQCGYDLTGNVSATCPECGSRRGGQGHE